MPMVSGLPVPNISNLDQPRVAIATAAPAMAVPETRFWICNARRAAE